MYAPRVPDFEELACTIRQHRIDCLWLTAGLFNAVVDHDPGLLADVRFLLTGGEALSVPHVRRALDHLPGTQLINGYGPTESTTFTCTWGIPSDLDGASRSVPIGRPIANTRVYILDDDRQPVPVGIPGELYIAGEGLACGYLNRPELTAGKFVPDTFSPVPGGRLYRSGDLCRWLPDGTIEFLGRMDGQVKLRGFRIELGEIEAALRAHPVVGQAAVLLYRRDGADAELVAYLTPADSVRLEEADLRRYLGTVLPDYMIPSVFLWLQNLPLNANGKLDRGALPSPPRTTDTVRCHEPRDELERTLVQIWSQVLGHPQVGTVDNLFEIGGHSLSALEICARAGRAFGRTISVADLLRAPTVADLAARIRSGLAGTVGESCLAVALKTGGSRPPLFCLPGLGGHAVNFREFAGCLRDVPCFGLDYVGCSGGTEMPESIEALAAAVVPSIRAVQPEGPYWIGGYSLGALVAFEVARQLEQGGHTVALLLLWDGYPASVLEQANSYWQRLRLHAYRLRKLPLSGWLPHLADCLRVSSRNRLWRPCRALFGRDSTANRQNAINARAMYAYQPVPVACPAVLFCSRIVPEWREALGIDMVAGWRPLLPAGFSVVQLDAEHLQLLRPPGVRELAGQTEAALARLMVREACGV